MKKIIILIFITCSVSVFAQNRSLQLGLGASFLGTGDFYTGLFEAEVGYKLNPYISSAFGLNSALGYRGNEIKERVTYQQGNANVFISPFRNDKRVNFKLGSGVSVNFVQEKRINWLSSNTNNMFYYESRIAVGLNMIVESSIAINENMFIGLKGFIQPYINGDINSGILVKIGTTI